MSYFLDSAGEGASGDTEELGEQVMGADLAQVQHGGQDPIDVGEFVLGARTACPAAFAAPSLVAEPLALFGQRRAA
ncbi:hypothetical protein ACIGW8_11830 [Streptomyces sioyaensis]|uniref:hypothetical protein n=1 Tax=Streptomyces sioyaensis TaxID=67364 RepID=UPI0037D8B26D